MFKDSLASILSTGWELGHLSFLEPRSNDTLTGNTSKVVQLLHQRKFCCSMNYNRVPGPDESLCWDDRVGESILLWGEVELADSFRTLLSPKLLEQGWPAVPKIDCQNCRRVHEGKATWAVRCCDVVPSLPNFLVGEILSSQEHPVVLEWLRSRRSDPFAIWVPPEKAQEHRSARVDGRYGKGCPLLVEEGGLCSVYLQRPALCVSYHCYYPSMLWKEAWSCLASLLEGLQDAASRYLVITADFDLSCMAEIWDEESDSLWEGCQQKEEFYQGCWQHWEGREAEFFRSCYERLQAMGDKERQDLHDWYRQQRMDRLAESDQQSSKQYQLLDQEFRQRGSLSLTPLEPPKPLRLRWQKKMLAPEENPYSLHQMESFLLWYKAKLTADTERPWWKFWDASKAEVQDAEGIGVTVRGNE